MVQYKPENYKIYAGTIDDVDALRKKYFLMDLNFGVGVSDLKVWIIHICVESFTFLNTQWCLFLSQDWLDVDTRTAIDIVDEFHKNSSSKASSTKVCVFNSCNRTIFLGFLTV